MTLWELHKNIRELLHTGNNPADKPVKAILLDSQVSTIDKDGVLHPSVIELDLVQFLQDESGTVIQLKAKYEHTRTPG
jgi:hypothetical protein